MARPAQTSGSLPALQIVCLTPHLVFWRCACRQPVSVVASETKRKSLPKAPAVGASPHCSLQKAFPPVATQPSVREADPAVTARLIRFS